MEEVERWLNQFGLGRYSQVFEEEGFDELFVVAELSEKDLDSLAIKDEATRKLLLQQSATLKDKLKNGKKLFYLKLVPFPSFITNIFYFFVNNRKGNCIVR